jgi:hypothetical protein
MKKSIIITVLLLLFLPSITALDCPKGIVNDSYPGDCGLYTDSNKNTICDYSENTLTSTNTTFSANIGINANPPQKRITNNYYFLPILIILILIYLISYFLTKFNKISQIFHKRIWNFLLLLGFLGVGISGIILVLRIEYGIEINSPFNMLFWHVETGIIMTIISVFHIIWHFSYFKSYIKKRVNK